MKKWRYIVILFIGVGAALLLSKVPWADNLNLYVYDFFLANTTVSSIAGDDIVVIGIDDEALQRFDAPLVLWHKYLAHVINGVADGKAKGIALDIIPTISLDQIAPELDRQLIRAMRRAHNQGTPVYLGFRAGTSRVMPHRKFLFAASDIGFLNLYPDRDGKIRSQITSLVGGNSRTAQALPSLMTGLIRTDMPLLAEERHNRVYIDYRLTLPPVFAFDEVYDWAEDGNIDRLKNAFKDKVVFIGVTSPTLSDIYTAPIKLRSAPTDRIPGVVIHALTTKTLLAEQRMRDVPPALVWSLAIAVALGSGLLFLSLSPRRAAGAVAAFLIVIVFGTMYALTSFWIIPVAPLLFSLLIPGACTGGYRYAIEYQQFRHLKRFFKSYVNPQVMQEIIDNPKLVSFAGKKVIATVMFTDIRNFTPLSEKLDPRVLVAGLNRYFSEMTKTVIEVDGYLNRYLGDGILAIFGAPNNLPVEGALAAVRCGHNMLERLEELNKSEIFPGVADKLQIGIGIHTGEAVVGNIGCYEKMDYSIIGDTVNLASRIEGLTKQFGTPLLISESTYNRVKDMVKAEFVDSVKVKGRVQEVKIYKLLSIKEEG
jgi:adenylate cyclase